jgi:N-acetylneuraminate epimerase
MKPLAFFFILILSNMPIDAQSPPTASIEWNIISEVPPNHNQVKSIGVAGPIVGVLQNKLIVAGGANFPDKMPWQGGKKFYNNTISIFSKQKNEIRTKIISTKLPNHIAYAANCVTPLGIVYAGGENELGLSDQVYLLNWNNTSNTIVATSLPSLPEAITNASLVCIHKTLYFIGGETALNSTHQFLSLDLEHVNTGWVRLPGLPKPLSNTVAVVQVVNGQKQIFIMGGRAKQQNKLTLFSSDVYSFDIKLNQWKSQQSLPYAMAAGTGFALSEKYIFLLGGERGSQFNKVEKTILSINAEPDQDKKQSLMNEKNKLLETHPGFSQEILLYNTAKNNWSPNGLIPFKTSVTTNAVAWEDVIVIPSGEIKAGVRTPRIISAKITLHE